MPSLLAGVGQLSLLAKLCMALNLHKPSTEQTC